MNPASSVPGQELRNAVSIGSSDLNPYKMLCMWQLCHQTCPSVTMVAKLEQLGKQSNPLRALPYDLQAKQLPPCCVRTKRSMQLVQERTRTEKSRHDCQRR
eukprot:CAMPEP_0204596694 /NCGR_PEP_ID=MMETSP0661-20131031/53385_1 /ASSEMBLY_ACC=CAM_ASM_000606 /TAXON_ID=109239 /ORGANISM="Alexandrium margalefi, Strain AMGDE01CS-322" /LENGTH=100 /DNA_ID=CAMNT_0051607321 /DNA_START=1 /DNA_END=301 /DNA_ORIENTATION=+